MNSLTHEIRVRVRFSEVDALRMVWHGSYVTYLEDAREAFGRHHGLGYMTIFSHGYYAPVYDLRLRYRHTATIDDELVIRTTLRPEHGGKLCFDYLITNAATGEEVLTAQSTQLFTTKDGEFDPQPEWFEEWKAAHMA